MAMKPFCGYNFADYWAHWLSVRQALREACRRSSTSTGSGSDADGKFLWPGFGDNLRVLRWIIDRCEGRVDALETPIGYLPKPGDIDVKGLDVSSRHAEPAARGRPEAWRAEMDSIGEYFAEFGDRVPKELHAEHQKVVRCAELTHSVLSNFRHLFLAPGAGVSEGIVPATARADLISSRS